MAVTISHRNWFFPLSFLPFLKGNTAALVTLFLKTSLIPDTQTTRLTASPGGNNGFQLASSGKFFHTFKIYVANS